MIGAIIASLALAGPVRPGARYGGQGWATMRTRFFAIHHADAPRTAVRVARMADDLLLDLGQAFGWDPTTPLHVVITDQPDTGWTGAQPQWGWIVLDASPDPGLFRWRGRRDHVRDALAHELAHVVSLRRGGALPPMASLGWGIGGLAEGERLAVGARVRVAPNEPTGLVEGIAQLASDEVGVDFWGSSRAATLRVAALAGRLLPFDAWLVDDGAHDPRSAELAYVQGYAFGAWLRARTGVDVFGQALASARTRYPSSWARRLDRAAGADVAPWWRQWQAEITADAAEEAAEVRARGLAVGLPTFDVPRVDCGAWVSWHDGTGNVVIRDDDGSPRVITSFDDGTWPQGPCRSPDGAEVVVSLLRTDQPNLWVIDVATGQMAALTADPHEALDPYWDDAGIWFASDPEGRFDIFRLDLGTGRVVQITRVVGGAMVPRVSADRSLVYDALTAEGFVPHRLDATDFVGDDVTAWFGVRPDPLGAARDLAFRPSDPGVVSVPYRPWRSLLPVALGPELRVDLPGGRLVVMGGGHLRIRDAVEQLELSIFGLVGEDWLGQGRLTWRGLGPELALTGTVSSDRRPDVRRTVRRAGIEVASAEGGPVTASIGMEAIALDVGPADDLRPAVRSVRATASVALPDRLTVTVTPALSDDDGPPWVRGTVRLQSPEGTWGRVRFDEELIAAAQSRSLRPEEQLRAGGDAVGALRLGTVEPSIPLPGFGPWSVAADALVVGSLGVIVPVAPRIDATTGGLFVRGVDARVGGHLAAVHPSHDPVLGDVTVELRLSASLWDRPWNSVVRVAWGFGTVPDSVPGGAISEALIPDGGPRVILGIGAGW